MNRTTTISPRCEFREILPRSTGTPRVDATLESRREFNAAGQSDIKEFLPQSDRTRNLSDSVSSNSADSAEDNTASVHQRVLVITSTYPRHADDGAASWMRETHRQMTKRGHRITVLAPAYKGLSSHTLDGIEVRRFRYAPASIERLTHEEGSGRNTRNGYLQLLAIPYIIFGCITAAWLVLTRKFDAVYVYSPYPNGLLGQIARLFSGAPLMIMTHSAEFPQARRKTWANPFLKQSLQAADLLISDCSDTAQKVTKLSQRKCHILPFGTNGSVANQLQPKNKVPQVLFSGELTECKGLEYLLRAVPQIVKKHPAQFIIVGNGDQRSKLEKLHQKLGLGEAVKFLGTVSDAQLSHEFANCDIWVNPTALDSHGNTEGLSEGVIQAYNYSKPVVAGRIGANLDAVVDGVTGRLVPEKDSAALADAICELLADPAKRQHMGRNGFYFAQTAFSHKQTVKALEAMTLELTRTPKLAPTLADNRSAFHSLNQLRSDCRSHVKASPYNSCAISALS